MKKGFFIIKILLLLAGLGLIVNANIKSSKTRLRLKPTNPELADVISDADMTGFQETPIPHYPGRITEKGVSLRAAAMATAQVEPGIKGFVDEINTLVCLDETGRICGAKILSHRETPYYMRMILDSDFLDKFKGRDIRESLEGIDAVTGATITAQAIIDDIESAALSCGREVYGLEVKRDETQAWRKAVARPKFVVLFVVLVLGLCARIFKFPKYRREAVYVLSIATIGFYLNTPFALPHIFQFASLNWPGISNPDLILLAGFILFTTLLAGPLYCGFLCPFGGIQDLIYRIPPKEWRWQVSPKVLRVAREVRYLILFICVVGFFGLGISAFSEIEPFSHLFALTSSALPWLLIIAVLVLSLFVKRFWCRFFCPTGACLVMLSSHRKYFRNIQKGLENSEIDPAEEGAEKESG